MKHNPRRKDLRHFKSALRGFSFFSFFHKEILRGWQPHFSSFFSRGQQLQQKVASQRLGTRRISKKIKLVFRDWNVAAWQVQWGADEAEGEIRGQSFLPYGHGHVLSLLSNMAGDAFTGTFKIHAIFWGILIPICTELILRLSFCKLFLVLIISIYIQDLDSRCHHINIYPGSSKSENFCSRGEKQRQVRIAFLFQYGSIWFYRYSKVFHKANSKLLFCGFCSSQLCCQFRSLPGTASSSKWRRRWRRAGEVRRRQLSAEVKL